MKKLLLVAAIALGTTAMVQAQEIDFGVKGGVNFAKLQGDAVEDADGRTGFHIGVVGEYAFNESFGVQMEALYTQQGLENDGDKLKLNYINVPVLLNYYIADSGFAIQAGPQLGILINDELEVDGDDTELEGTEELDLSAGGGVMYKFKEGTSLEGFNVSVRYMIGLNNVFEDGDTFGDDLTNSNLFISLGYKF